MYTPKNALLLKCIDQIVLNVSNNYYGENPLCITGPALVGKLFILEKYDLKLVDIEHTYDGKLAYKNKTGNLNHLIKFIKYKYEFLYSSHIIEQLYS